MCLLLIAASGHVVYSVGSPDICLFVLIIRRDVQLDSFNFEVDMERNMFIVNVLNYLHVSCVITPECC